MTLDFDLTNHIDLPSLLLDLRVSLNSDGGNRPVGVCRYTTIAARARNQDIDQTENSHISICTHPESKTKQLRLLIPLLGYEVGYTSAIQNSTAYNQEELP